MDLRFSMLRFMRAAILVVVIMSFRQCLACPCFVTPYKEDIQRAMDLLCPGYELEEIDLNDYDQIN